MENMRDNEHWLKQFHIKSCTVKLDRVPLLELKKIRIRCVATCLEQDEKLRCHMTQTDSNTFCVSIKRVKHKGSNPPIKNKVHAQNHHLNNDDINSKKISNEGKNCNFV